MMVPVRSDAAGASDLLANHPHHRAAVDLFAGCEGRLLEEVLPGLAEALSAEMQGWLADLDLRPTADTSASAWSQGAPQAGLRPPGAVDLLGRTRAVGEADGGASKRRDCVGPRARRDGFERGLDGYTSFLTRVRRLRAQRRR